MRKIRAKVKSSHIAFTIIGFWYVSFFPGRIGFDYSLLIKMVRQGESTDWWTSLFYWYIRIFSFNGRTIFLCSLLGLVALSHAVRMFTKTLPTSEKIQNRVFLIAALTPLFPVFGLTVSHDVFQTSGLILFFAREVAIVQKKYVSGLSSTSIAALASLQLLTTQTGIFILVVYLIIKIIQKNRNDFFAITLTALIINLFAGVGVSHVDKGASAARILISDIKCVSQHPESEISAKEWKFLESIAPRNDWLKSNSCASIDEQLGEMNLSDHATLSINLIENYMSISMKNPAIVVIAHLQKSRGALPPPFFQGPENQVNLDATLPVGFNTNIALQSGPEILHPSIDAPGLKVENRLLKVLESIAQAPVLLINQASWFWGWGGFWLWPLTAYLLYGLRIRSWGSIVCISAPLLFHHASMVLVGPGAFGRYYMSAIIMGILSAVYLLGQSLDSND